MFISTGQFVHDVLPGMMHGRTAFRVLVATYNDADLPESYPDGLTVRLIAGNPLEGDAALMKLISSMADGDRYLDERRVGQKTVERAVLPLGSFDLAVVYLGLTQFDRALGHALRLKRNRVATHVVVLTCDCDKETKAGKLAIPEHLAHLSATLLTRKCGGCADLEDLVGSMAEIWPQVKSA